MTAPPEATAGGPGSTARPPQRVLVAEPDGDAAFILAAWLERRGYQVAVASTAAAATRCVAEVRVDVVLLSGRLPDMSLEELAQRLRAQASQVGLRIIATACEALTREDGIDATLRSPLTAQALDEVLGG
jgi:DNA-binding response OmpR family regulator